METLDEEAKNLETNMNKEISMNKTADTRDLSLPEFGVNKPRHEVQMTDPTVVIEQREEL